MQCISSMRYREHGHEIMPASADVTFETHACAWMKIYLQDADKQEMIHVHIWTFKAWMQSYVVSTNMQA